MDGDEELRSSGAAAPLAFAEAAAANNGLQDEESLPSRCKVAQSIMSQAGPSMVMGMTSFASEIINTIFIGQVGNKHQLAAVGLGNMMQNCFGLSIGMGLASALDTLSSQANGAGEKHLACIYMQRGRLILGVQLIWILPVLSLSHLWLVAIGQDPIVSQYASEYSRITAFFLVFNFQNALMRRLCTAFLRPKGPMVISMITTSLHILWAWLFVSYLKLGLTGLALANGMNWMTRFILMTSLWWKIAPQLGLKRVWVLGLERASLRGWKEYLKIGIPALVQVASEWWFFEILALVVGYLGPTPLAAHVATMNFITLPFMVPIGCGQGTSTRVGNAIGAGTPKLAKRTAMVAIALILVLWTGIALLLVLFRGIIAMALSNDADVRDLIQKLLLIYVFQGFFDASQNVMSAILRALGSMRVASVTYLISFYLVMLPVALLLTFPCGLGVSGAWWSMGIGTSFAAVVFIIKLSSTDYAALSAAALARMANQ